MAKAFKVIQKILQLAVAVVLFLCAVVGVPGSALASASERISEQTIELYIQAAARYHQLDPDLLRALVWQESRMATSAVSPKGAVGLTQLMPDTARQMNVNGQNPWQNIYGGAKYLRQLLDRYNGQIDLALAAYNAGPSRVKDSVPLIEETQNYVAAVLFYYDWYRQNT